MSRQPAESASVRRLLACLLLAAVLPAAASARSTRATVVVQGPATLAESGFVRAVLAPAAHRRGLSLRYVSSDGAAALSALSAGKAALALSDSPAAEAAFVASGASLEPAGRLVLYGDDVLVGPAADPAGVGQRAPRDIAAALRLVAASGAAGRSDFVAGGIGRSELALWQSAGVVKGEQAVPVGERWYHHGASDPADVIRTTSACGYASKACYALVDRGVLKQLQAAGGGRGLRVVVARNDPGAGDAALAHPVRAYATRRSGAAARALLGLLTSPALQAAIEAYPTRQAPGYHAAAAPLLLLEQGVPDLVGRLTEGTPGGAGLAGVRLRLIVQRPGHPPVLLVSTRTGEHGEFSASARVDASRKLRGTLVVRSDATRGQTAGIFTVGRMG